jgi:hypothetical protein
MPSSLIPMIASSEDSTIAASRARASSASARIFTYPTTNLLPISQAMLVAEKETSASQLKLRANERLTWPNATSLGIPTIT